MESNSIGVVSGRTSCLNSCAGQRTFAPRDMSMNDDDHSWDPAVKGSSGEAYNRKHKEWAQREWKKWLAEHLTFPFTVVRQEDHKTGFSPQDPAVPFRFGHTMKILNLEIEDDLYGVIVKARESRRVGHVPLCDVEVKPKTDKNFWPVREYMMWFANR